MHKKKLLIATDNFLPRWDGISRFLSLLIPKLLEDFEISVLAPDFKGEKIEIDGVKVHRIKTSWFNVGDYPVPQFNPREINIHVQNADLVFTQTIGPIGGLAIKAAWNSKKPVVAYVHSIEWELIAKSISPLKMVEYVSYNFTKKIIKSLYNKCSLIITPSIEISQVLASEGIKTLKTVVHLGIDLEIFTPAEDKKKAKEDLKLDPNFRIIGFCGRIGKEKDLITLYKAFVNVEKRTKYVRLLIVGDGIESQKKYFLKNKNVIITGQINNVVPYLQAMDIFVLPSLTETSSLATMEAMACGLPVISTKVGYIRSYIKEKENGLFFPKRNETILALKIKWLLDNEYVSRVLGANARKTMEENYNWEKTVNKIKYILEGF